MNSIKKTLHYISETFCVLATLGIVLVFVSIFLGVGIPGTTYGSSMSHNNKDELEIGYCLFTKDIKYGDVVIAYDARDGHEVCKRVIGLPGDKVEVYDGYIYINGELNEDYSYGKHLNFNREPTTLKDNQYFVCGDNRGSSVDSRYYGPVYLKGKFISLLKLPQLFHIG